jgi:hypothetical protein
MANDAYIDDDSYQQQQDQEHELWVYEQERKEHIADLQKQFTEFLYNNYTIGNGEQLIHILEQGDALEAFLELKGLPADTEIEI